jgi:hypothetical protein
MQKSRVPVFIVLMVRFTRIHVTDYDMGNTLRGARVADRAVNSDAR